MKSTTLALLSDIHGNLTALEAVLADLAGGHTHTQLVRRFRQSWLVNPGSVGLPYEVLADDTLRRPHGAEYGLVSWENGRITIQLRRVPYDTSRVAPITRASGMPHADRWLANWGH